MALPWINKNIVRSRASSPQNPMDRKERVAGFTVGEAVHSVDQLELDYNFSIRIHSDTKTIDYDLGILRN
jgi:hypothetical protein